MYTKTFLWFCIFDSKGKVCLEKLAIYFMEKYMVGKNAIRIMCCFASLAIYLKVSVVIVLHIDALGRQILCMKMSNLGCRWHLPCTVFSGSTTLLYQQTHLDKKLFAGQSFFHLHSKRMLCFKSILTLLTLKKY